MIEKTDVLNALREIGVLIENTNNFPPYEIQVPDSITYINTVIMLEEMLHIEFTDDYLTSTLFNSVETLTESVNAVYEAAKI